MEPAAFVVMGIFLLICLKQDERKAIGALNSGEFSA